MNDRKLPKGLYRRKESPYIWGKIKLKKMGKPLYFSTETADERLAEEIYAVRRGEYLQGKIEKPKTKIGLEEMLRKKYMPLCKNQPSYKTKISHINMLCRHEIFKGKQADKVTRADCLRYKIERATEVKQGTVNRELGTLRSAYNRVIEDLGFVLENPVSEVSSYSEKKFRRIRVMSQEEQNKFFSDKKLTLDKKELFIFAIKTGIRQGEIRDLQWTDIDFKNGLILVRAGEEDDNRYVPMFVYTRQILERRFNEGGPKRSKYVFPDPYGNKMTKDGWITSSFKAVRLRHKIEGLRFHDLRHTFASEFIMSGGDFATLSRYLGHLTKTMTDRYIQLSPQYKAAQIMLLPRVPAFEGVFSANPGYVEVTGQKQAQKAETDGQRKSP